MASKVQQEPSVEDAEDLLETVDKNLDRVKVLYEQHFLGIQKQAPTHLHNEVERKLRDLAQMQLRNTRLRYRLATIQQKFGAYNAYWRRTLRQIENGTYARNLHKIGREAARTGANVPEEILAAMPKRMREQVQRDRERALALAARREGAAEASLDSDEGVAEIREPSDVRHSLKTPTGAHVVDEASNDFDIDAFFEGVEAEEPKAQRPQSAASVPVQAQPPRAQPSRNPLPASQAVRPNPIAQGAAAARGPVHVEAIHGPFLRPPTQTGPEASTAPAPGGSSRPSVAPPVVSTPRPTAAPTMGPGGVQPTMAPPTIPTAGPGGVRPTMAPPTIPTAGPGGVRPTMAPTMEPGGVRPTAAPTMGPGGVRPTMAPPTIPTAGAGGARPTAAPTMGPGGVRPTTAPPTTPNRTDAPVTPSQTRAPIRPPSHTDGSAPARPAANPRSPQRPPPGMTDADVNALYANYVKAKQMVGETIAPGEHSKLLKTINAQAPKIMHQYNAKAVDFSVIVKDNQVILRAKPKLKP